MFLSSLTPNPQPLSVNFRSAALKLFGFFFHAGLKRSLLVQLFLHGVITYVLGDLHRTKMRTAHRTEMRYLCPFRWQGLIVKILRRLRVERQVELILPAKLETRLREGIITRLRTRMTFGEVGSVRGNLVGNHARLHVFPVRQSEM